MLATFNARASIVAAAALAMVLTGHDGIAREPRSRRSAGTVSASATPVPSGQVPPTILEAEARGIVSIKYIPNDSRSAQIIVTNRSRRPATLRLPAAFAGVPVLAQMGGGQQGAGFGAGGIGAQPQSTGGGGGMGGQGMNGIGGAGAGGGGAFSIPPEKTRVFRVTTVCLEHGKPEPSSRHSYTLSAVESFSSDPKLAVVLESLGRGELSQKVAQAAAWHIASGLSWERLAAEMIDHAGGVQDEPYFTPAELAAAHRVVATAERQAAMRRPSTPSAGNGEGGSGVGQ